MNTRRAGVVASLSLTWLLGCRGPSTEPSPLGADVPATGYRWYALEYARSSGVPKRALLADQEESIRVDMSWHFYLGLGQDRVVLVDVGSDTLSDPESDLRGRWRVDEARTSVEALAATDIAPDQVTDILLTHHHWDHSDTIDRFTGAAVHAHRHEWSRIEGRLGQRIEAIEREGRLHLFDGTGHEPIPGVEARVLGRHTAAHTVYVVACPDRERLALLGDAAYLYENVEGGVPIRATSAPDANVEDVRGLITELGSEALVPGHDRAVFRRHPLVALGVADLCARSKEGGGRLGDR